MEPNYREGRGPDERTHDSSSERRSGEHRRMGGSGAGYARGKVLGGVPHLMQDGSNTVRRSLRCQAKERRGRGLRFQRSHPHRTQKSSCEQRKKKRPQEGRTDNHTSGNVRAPARRVNAAGHLGKSKSGNATHREDYSIGRNQERTPEEAWNQDARHTVRGHKMHRARESGRCGGEQAEGKGS